jgi:hypothetical protein
MQRHQKLQRCHWCEGDTACWACISSSAFTPHVAYCTGYLQYSTEKTGAADLPTGHIMAHIRLRFPGFNTEKPRAPELPHSAHAIDLLLLLTLLIGRCRAEQAAHGVNGAHGQTDSHTADGCIPTNYDVRASSTVHSPSLRTGYRAAASMAIFRLPLRLSYRFIVRAFETTNACTITHSNTQQEQQHHTCKKRFTVRLDNLEGVRLYVVVDLNLGIPTVSILPVWIRFKFYKVIMWYMEAIYGLRYAVL